MVRGSLTSVDGTTVELVEFANTNLLSQVDVSGNGGSSHVEPSLSILGRELVAGRGLDDLNVAGDIELTLSLEERSVSLNELLSGNVSVVSC